MSSKKEKQKETKPDPEPAAVPSETEAPAAKKSAPIPRVVSLIVLSAVVLLTGVLFFRVMANFIVPLFLAAVLAVIFQPLHAWSLTKLPGRRYGAALLTTSLITVLVLAPMVWMGWRAFLETHERVESVLGSEAIDKAIHFLRANAADEAQEALTQQVGPLADGPKLLLPDAASEILEEQTRDNIAAAIEERLDAASDGPDADQETDALDSEQPDADAPAEEQDRATPWLGWLLEQAKMLKIDLIGILASSAEMAAQLVVQLGLLSLKALVAVSFGLAIMIIALYYFFADGPSMIEELMHLSPLDDDYERDLLQKFSDVSRAVVLATLLSAVVQGLLGGIGYWLVLESGSPVFLLTVLTMLLAIIPFLGATAVWAPVALWIFFFQPDGFWPAIGLAIYGFCIVSSADNVLKPLILSGQSNLHPLLALLSVLGGIQLLGPIGILVGPMLVAFMQALLGMLRTELDRLDEAEA